ncbi:MAG: hypothetical protein GX971_07320 [Firmicutes bacterium]|nr:hypothetical protein [Bacillota bacterium]
MDKTMIWGLFRVVLALGLTIPAAIYATRWYGRKQAGSGKSLKVKEALSLGSNRALYVVEWEEKRLLLGVTGQGITVLDAQLNSQHTSEEVTE